MSSVKDKKLFCCTKLQDFSSAPIGSEFFYSRYEEFKRLFAKMIPSIKFEEYFAEPVFNIDTKNLDWYILENGSEPIKVDDFAQSDESAYKAARQKRQELQDLIIQAQEKCSPNQKPFFAAVLLGLQGEQSDNYTYWRDNHPIFVVWGVRAKPGRQIEMKLSDDITNRRAYKVQYKVEGQGEVSFTEIARRHNYVLQGEKDIPVVIPAARYEFTKWLPFAPHGAVITSDITFTAVCESDGKYQITFKTTRGGSLNGETMLYVENNTQLTSADFPEPIADEGYEFSKWSPRTDFPVTITGDMEFLAHFSKVEEPPIETPPTPINEVPVNDTPVDNPETDTDAPQEDTLKHRVRFISDSNKGKLIGETEFQIEHNGLVNQSMVPTVEALNGYTFKGWDRSLDEPITEDTDIHAKFDEPSRDWRFWNWDFWRNWNLKGCLTWLLRLLLLLLLLLFLAWLLQRCGHNDYSGCSRGTDPIAVEPVPSPYPTSPDPIPNPNPTPTPEPPVGGGENVLPVNPNHPVPVPTDSIIDDDRSRRRIVNNRLNVLLDDDALTVEGFAWDFKNAYPDDAYQVIYSDPVVKRLQIIVPSQRRETVKRELISKLPSQYNDHNVFIWDEALFERDLTPDDSRIGECWYLDAIRAYPAWDITMGDTGIVVAIVDDGFDLRHEELASKVYKPYNVFTRTTDVSESSQHGTHVAGTAIAIANNHKGISGIAPNCKWMPIKVADENGNMPTTAVIDGVLYAVYSGADVVNLSLGMDLQTNIPVNIQREMISGMFKEEERVWRKIFEIAEKNNVAIVLAAGNENLLAGIDPMHRTDNTIVVAAVDKYHNPMWNKSIFSNYGEDTDISAPGVDILSTVGNGNYVSKNGTSMASPIVTGAVALVKSVNRVLTTKQIRKIFQETGLDVNGKIGRLIQLDKALEKAKNTAPEDPNQPVPGTGDVQITLRWHNHNDLDLHCVDPNGEVIYYNHKQSASGGQLDIDMNANGSFSSQPLENIFWPTGGAINGTYRVSVNYFRRHDTYNSETPYEVTVKYGDKQETFNGTLYRVGESINICEFTL